MKSSHYNADHCDDHAGWAETQHSNLQSWVETQPTRYYLL
jgi:hypothetical protein